MPLFVESGDISCHLLFSHTPLSLRLATMNEISPIRLNPFIFNKNSDYFLTGFENASTKAESFPVLLLIYPGIAAIPVGDIFTIAPEVRRPFRWRNSMGQQGEALKQ